MRKTLALVLSLFGLFDAAYLWWVYTSPTHPLVCLGTGCDEVRASRFAFWGGIPTPAFGALMYAALIILLIGESFAQPAFSKVLRRIAFYLSAAGLIISLYLTSLEAFQIHAWCAWCVAQQIAIALIFVLLGMELGKPESDTPKRAQRNVIVLIAAVVIAIPAFAWLSHHSAAEEKKLLDAGTSPEKPADLSHLIRPDSHAIGPADAPVTLVEFGDFQCPSCIVAEAVNHDIRSRFPKQVRFIFREFPLAHLHVYAEKAAEAAECAADQNKFWPMHDRLYAADGELALVQLKYYAQDIGLDTAKFNACLDGGEKAALIQQDIADGKAAGVGATPTFFINGAKHIGGLNMQDFITIVSAAQKVAAPAEAPKPTSEAAPAPQPTRSAPQQPSVAKGPDPAKPPVETAAAGTSIVPGLAPASNPLVLGAAQDSGDCDPNGPKGPGKNEIPTTTAQQMFKKGATFVDIRLPKDFAKSHIPGAVNLPLNKLSDGVSTLPKDKPVVVYESGLAAGDVCASSRAAAGLIASRGFKDVKVYHDGFAAWQKAGAPVQ